jgi:hypothetical protein
MANRNVSQLSENTAPQDTDWLLGASGNSPSVLQKITVGNLIKTNIKTKTSELENDSNFVQIDLAGIQDGQSFKWDETLQKIVFFSPSSSSSSSSSLFSANFLTELMIPCFFVTDYQIGTINPRGF